MPFATVLRDDHLVGAIYCFSQFLMIFAWEEL